MSDCEKKEKDGEGNSLAEKLIRSRTILCGGTVDDKMVESVSRQLFIMQEDDAAKPVFIYVNSPGGAADSGFALYDLLRFVEPPVITVCNGICASAAILIFLGADRGRRYSLPHSRFLLHQPSTAAQGTASDLQITAQEILKLRQRYNEIVGEHTGRKPEDVTRDSARDFWLDPAAAKAYGLLDCIVGTRAEIQGLGA